LAEWLYEEGIGENRAILVEDGEILEAVIELPGGLRAGTVASARLATILIPGRRGIVRLDDGAEALLEPIPAGLTEGGALIVEIVREAIPEPGSDKLAVARAAAEAPRPGPALIDRIGPARRPALHRPDEFEDADWSILLEQAASGEIPFAGGRLRMSLTPAMTLFDVDGALAPEALAVAGAGAAGRVIRRFGISGSIGVDLPTVAGKAARADAAAALDAVLPQPFERTAVNGFGFLQIVRRRERASIPELLRADPAGAAARALVRRACRGSGGPTAITAAPAVIARLEREPDWLRTITATIGGAIRLSADAALPIYGGHVQPDVL